MEDYTKYSNKDFRTFLSEIKKDVNFFFIFFLITLLFSPYGINLFLPFITFLGLTLMSLARVLSLSQLEEVYQKRFKEENPR